MTTRDRASRVAVPRTDRVAAVSLRQPGARRRVCLLAAPSGRRMARRLVPFLLAVAVCVGCAQPPARPTDFDTELTQIDRRIATSEPARAAGLRYARAALTGLPADADLAARTASRAIETFGPHPDLLLLQATVDMHVHRWQEAERLLAASPVLAASAEGRLLRADVDLQHGRYAEARQACEAAVRQNRTWDALARLAHVTSLTGDTDAADALYAEAEDEITAKEMRAYAWVALQRGWLQFSRGRYDRAAAHYERAERAYSGYWMTDDYVAELLAAQGKFAEAEARYKRLVARVPRPDLQQRLGDLYTFMGQASAAAPWHDMALKGYLDATARGDVQYLHHLTAFYADVTQNGAEAVTWAQRDLASRESAPTLDALAWALYRAGRLPDALAASRRALATGVRDAHTLAHAASIHLAAGEAAAGRDLQRDAAAFNPGYENFHVHR